VSGEPASLSEREERFGEIAFAYLRAKEEGQRPDPREWLTRYPEFAPELASFFADQEEVDRLGAPLREIARAVERDPGPADDLLRTGVLGDFRIIRVVGRGGMGIVYEAEQVSLGRRVALKVLPFAATMDSRHLQRFHNEARAAASLHHEHIVPVHAVGCERAVHVYAMQFIEGKSLAELIAAQRQTPASGARPPSATTAAAAPTEAPRDVAYFRRVAEWGIQAAEALEYAHTLGIIHRDVKPANLMVDGRGKLWVTDFGLARLGPDLGLTMTGDVVGTLRYMSPEQALARHGLVDHRTDVYSLGTTLYELLTGRPAVEGQDRQDFLNRIAGEEPRPPRALDRGVPADLETIVLKALEKHPQDRYTTAQELADDLRRWAEDRPIAARRPTVTHRLLKLSKRHQAALLTTCLFLTLAAVGLAINSALIWREKRGTEQALKRAEEQERLAQANADRARTQRERAESNLNWSLNVTRDVLDRLGTEEFAETMAIPEVRRRLVAHAIRELQGHTDEKSADPAVRQDTARIYGAIALLYSSQADHDAARAALEKARDVLDALATESGDDFRLWLGLGHTHVYLASELDRLGLKPRAVEVWRGAVQAFSQAVHVAPDNASACNNLAWFLVTCPEPSVRDPARAVELAKKAVALEPTKGATWNTLGVAQYRAGAWKAAIDSLMTSLSLPWGNDDLDLFFLAMAHWQLGEKVEARRWYDEAVKWTKANRPDPSGVREWSAEAAQLLGIEDVLAPKDRAGSPRKD
jgi:serine/threonine protein kinase